MAGLLVAIAIMGITMSMIMPTWRTWAQREKEAELIFRGEQYMRAIELYQRRFAGAYPTDLDALVVAVPLVVERHRGLGGAADDADDAAAPFADAARRLGEGRR